MVELLNLLFLLGTFWFSQIIYNEHILLLSSGEKSKCNVFKTRNSNFSIIDSKIVQAQDHDAELQAGEGATGSLGMRINLGLLGV